MNNGSQADGTLTAENMALRQRVAELETALSVSQQNEERLHMILSSATDWAWEVDAYGQYTYVSSNVAAILGYEPHELLGKTPFDLMPPKEAERVQAIFGPIVAARQPIRLLENVNLHRTGNCVVMETSGVPFYDDTGTLCGYRGVDRDITGRKQVEDRLRLAQFTVDRAADSIHWIASDGTIVYANDTACAILGYTRAEMLNMRIFDIDPFFHEEDMGPVWEDLQQRGVQIFEAIHRRKDGHDIPVEVVSNYLEFQGREYACTFSRDITERRRAEQERAALLQQVIDAQRVAIRELSTPLIPLADGVLAMPLIGSIDSTRAQQIMETLLEGVARQQSRVVILDITGVQVVDTQVANAFIQVAQAVKLLGAQVILTGIQPAMAQTLVSLGVGLEGIITHGTLQAGIDYALKKAGRNSATSYGKEF